MDMPHNLTQENADSIGEELEKYIKSYQHLKDKILFLYLNQEKK